MNLKTKYLEQRKMLGLLCALLAPASVLLGIFGIKYNEPGWWYSISATYYASSKIAMIGVLFTTAVYFFIYNGYDVKDKICNRISSITALGVLLFPCSATTQTHVGLFCLPTSVSMVFHGISAGVLFASFAYNCIFLFTLGNSGTSKKKIRNIIYRICGIVILLTMTLLGLHSILNWPEWCVILLEWVILTSYAFAWFVKGEAIERLCD